MSGGFFFSPINPTKFNLFLQKQRQLMVYVSRQEIIKKRGAGLMKLLPLKT